MGRGTGRGRLQGLRQTSRVFWSSVVAGCSTETAAAAAGVSIVVGHRWFVEAGGMPPLSLAPLRGRYLSLAEREEIAVGLAAGAGIREVARGLGRSPSTVSREVHRNIRRRYLLAAPPGRPRRGPRNLGAVGYRATVAQKRADVLAARPKRSKLACSPRLRAEVQRLLVLRWSPEQITAMLPLLHPDEQDLRVSHETIYQSLYVQGRGALRRELAVCLRTGRAVRKPRRRAQARTPRIRDKIMISERPAEATDRAVPGHWEGDLIIGAHGKSAMGTLVERSTRFCLLLHLPAGNRAESVRDAMLIKIGELPEQLWRSLTWDQGIEMARHREITVASGLPIYFCDPASPWQRGSNENTNGLLRQYFPKGSDLSVHTAENLNAVAAQLNARPRKTLAWRTPAEALNALLSHPFKPPGVATTA